MFREVFFNNGKIVSVQLKGFPTSSIIIGGRAESSSIDFLLRRVDHKAKFISTTPYPVCAYGITVNDIEVEDYMKYIDSEDILDSFGIDSDAKIARFKDGFDINSVKVHVDESLIDIKEALDLTEEEKDHVFEVVRDEALTVYSNALSDEEFVDKNIILM